MKLSTLKQIIKEEVHKVLKEYKAIRTGKKWNGTPVYKDDEHNEFIKIGQHSVDIAYNGRPRPDADIKKEIENIKKATKLY